LSNLAFLHLGVGDVYYQASLSLRANRHKRRQRYIYRPFKGALDNIYLLHVQKVKLVNIVAYCDDELGLFGWQDVPLDHYVVGVYRDGGYYVLTKNGQLISHPL